MQNNINNAGGYLLKRIKGTVLTCFFICTGVSVPIQLLRRQEVRTVPVARVVRATALRGVGWRWRGRAPHADVAARACARVLAALLRRHLGVLRQPARLLL